MVALIREPPRDDGPGAPHLAALEPRRGRRLGDRAARRAAAGTGRRPASRARSSVERDRRVHPPRVRRRDHGERVPMPPRRLDRSGSRWSTSRRGRRRSRSSRRSAAAPARGPATPGRSTRSRRACWCCCPVRQLGLRRASSAWTSATSRTSTSTATTTTGDPEGEIVERARAAAAERSTQRLERLRGEVELPIPAASAVKIGGERAYKLARRGIEVEMPLRRSQVYALDVIAYSGDADDRASARPARQLRHVRPLDRGGARRALPALRRTAVGPFAVEEADRRLDCRSRRARRRPGALEPARRTAASARVAPERSVPASSRSSAADGARERRPHAATSSSGGRARSRSGRSTACTSATAR